MRARPFVCAVLEVVSRVGGHRPSKLGFAAIGTNSTNSRCLHRPRCVEQIALSERLSHSLLSAVLRTWGVLRWNISFPDIEKNLFRYQENMFEPQQRSGTYIMYFLDICPSDLCGLAVASNVFADVKVCVFLVRIITRNSRIAYLFSLLRHHRHCSYDATENIKAGFLYR
jgi:hypothetical protein